MNPNTQTNNAPRTISQYVGALLVISGAIILLYLIPEIYYFLQNPTKSSFITSLVTNNIKGTFHYVSKEETINLDFSCIPYMLAIILNMFVFTILGGIAKTLITSGVRLFEMPDKAFFENLKKQMKS